MATTARELIEFLRDYPGGTPVVLAKDASGGALAPFEEITEEELDLAELRDNFDYEDDRRGDDEEGTDGVPVIVLWPSR